MDSIFENGNRKHVSKKTNKIGLHADIFKKILYVNQNEKIEIKMFSTNMVDIDKF